MNCEFVCPVYSANDDENLQKRSSYKYLPGFVVSSSYFYISSIIPAGIRKILAVLENIQWKHQNNA